MGQWHTGTHGQLETGRRVRKAGRPEVREVSCPHLPQRGGVFGCGGCAGVWLSSCCGGKRLFLGRADSRECCIHRQTGFGFTTLPDRQMACAPRSPWPMALAACLCPSNVDSFRFLSASPPFLPTMVAVGWCAPKTKGQARWLQHSSRLARDLPIPGALLRVPFASCP